MAKSKVKLNGEYLRLARKTNALGLTNYPIKGELSKGQKSWLTKLAGENSQFHDVIKSPKQFEILNAPASFLQKAKEAGAVVSKSQLFVRNKYANGKKTYKNVRIESGALMFDESHGQVTLKHRVIYPGTKDFFKISEQLQNGQYPLGSNSQVTFKIGGNSPFKRAFTDYADLFAYVSDMQAGKVLKNADFGKILPEISFVTIERKKKRKPKND